MKVLILGATGATGQHVVSQALDLGHEVTVFVRDQVRLRIGAERVRVVTGSLPDSADALAAAVRGQDAVISTLGVGSALKAKGLIGRSAPVIVRAMTTEGVRRLVFCSAYGVGATRRDLPLFPKLLITVLLRDVYADKQNGDDTLMRSDLDWTIAYPVTLTNGPHTGRYRVGEHLTLRGVPKIARADLADFLLSQLADPTNVRKGVLVSS